MFSTDTVPTWFRQTPLFGQLVTRERADAEATRSTLAKDRARILAAEVKAAPKREQQMADARAALTLATLTYDTARATFDRTQSESLSGSMLASRRVGAIDHELHTLAHPMIGLTLTRLQNLADALRSQPLVDGEARLAAVRDAQARVRALYSRADIDVAAELTTITAPVALELHDPLAS